jgi:hypothetical protein
VASRCPRLAENTIAAVSAAIPTTALAIVLRTGTAVLPAPGWTASRIPSRAEMWMMPLAAAAPAGRRGIRPVAAGLAGAAAVRAARQAAGTAQAMVASTVASAPRPATVASARTPG